MLQLPAVLVAATAAAILFLAATPVSRAQQADACATDVSAFLPAPFNTSDLALTCRPMWNNFVLRYSQSQDNVLSVVLSNVYTSGWMGIGFSPDGMMVGSSAVVGWVGRDHKVHARQFLLSGQTSSKVEVSKGNLHFPGGRKPAVALFGPNLYVAFQVRFPSPVKQQYILLAFGAAPPVNKVLKKHDDKTSINFDFSAGTSAPSTYPYQLKRNHGILAIFGWGVLLPIGALVARFCRKWDPLWYYLHMAIQFTGFIIGLAAVVAGISLYDKLHADVKAHRGLGIFIFVLAILQVLAFFLRPNKDSKHRKYWNWYHHWTGRLVVFLAAINILVGIKAGGAGQPWKIGYAVNLSIILVVFIVLEIMFFLRSSKKSVDQPF